MFGSDWTGFPSPSLRQWASTSQRFWHTGRKGTSPEATINLAVGGGGVCGGGPGLTAPQAAALVQWGRGCWKKWVWRIGRKDKRQSDKRGPGAVQSIERRKKILKGRNTGNEVVRNPLVTWKTALLALPKCPETGHLFHHLLQKCLVFKMPPYWLPSQSRQKR